MKRLLIVAACVFASSYLIAREPVDISAKEFDGLLHFDPFAEGAVPLPALPEEQDLHLQIITELASGEQSSPIQTAPDFLVGALVVMERSSVVISHLPMHSLLQEMQSPDQIDSWHLPPAVPVDSDDEG